VQRLLALAALGVGIALLLRRRRRRSAAETNVVSPHAEELRSRLAESRAAEEAGQAAEQEAEAVATEDDLDARRREVHERAQRSLDELG
jgi:hypothetical protein